MTYPAMLQAPQVALFLVFAPSAACQVRLVPKIQQLKAAILLACQISIQVRRAEIMLGIQDRQVQKFRHRCTDSKAEADDSLLWFLEYWYASRNNNPNLICPSRHNSATLEAAQWA